MNATTNELYAIVDRFADLSISVVGDVILDHYIWGEVSRISPEAPVVVVHVRKEEYSLGGAANVAKNITSLGAKASIVGAVGQDEKAATIKELLQADGVATDSLVAVEGRSTTVKSRVMARAQQVVRVDRETVEALPTAAQEEIVRLVSAEIGASDGVVVSDYAKGVITPRTYTPFSAAYREKQFSLNKKPLVVDPKNANFGVYQGATVVKPNRLEAEAASGKSIRTQEDAVVAGRILLDLWDAETVLVTLGELGMVSVSNDPSIEPVAVPTRAKEVFDVSGAGDTVAAVYSLSLAAGATVYQAAELSNIAAGVVVAEIGAVAITLEQLRSAIEQVRKEN